MVSGKEIFISHATADKEFVSEFVNFIRLGMDISEKKIYCVSYGKGEIPSGDSFTEHIRDNINSAKIVFLILTPNFLDSQFCMAELGASWALNKKLIPIIVPPLGFDILERTPLKARQAIKLQSIDQIADELKEAGYDFSITLFNKQGEKFKDMLDGLLQTIGIPKSVSIEEHEALKQEVDTLAEKNIVLQLRIDQLEEYSKKLEDAKEPDEIWEIKKAETPLWQLLMESIDTTKEKIRSIENAVISAIFYSIKGETFIPSKEDWQFESIDSLKSKERLLVDQKYDFDVEANIDYPDIEEAYNSLYELNKLIKECVDYPEIQDTFRKEYRMPLSLNTNFIEQLLNIKILSNQS
jgi:hypothetical protein